MRILVATVLCLLTSCCSVYMGDPRNATRTLGFADGGTCSGTYVKPDVVLTASHCVDGDTKAISVNG